MAATGKEDPKSGGFNLVVWLRWQAYLFRHYLLHTLNDIRKNKVNYSLGFFACFLVVFVVSLVVTIIGNTPVVFLRLAELQVGEMDLVVSPGGWTGNSQLNYTLVSNILHTEQAYTYSSPRYQFGAYVINSKSCPSNLDPYDVNWKYRGNNCYISCFDDLCPADEFYSTVYVIDTERERNMGLGRDWNKDPPADGYIYLQNGIASEAGVGVGDIVYVKFNLYDAFHNLWDRANKQGPYNYTGGSSYSIYGASTVFLPLKIAATFGSGQGKFGTGQKSAIIMEYKYLMGQIVRNLDPDWSAATFAFMNNTDLYQVAQQVVFNLPPPRVDIYIGTNQDVIRENVVKFASQILYRIGFNLLDSDLQVLGELSNSAVISLFLGLILNIIIFILLFLSIILIYSLLMINVETKTFEMGVMRMIGITRRGLINLLLFQAFSYSLPSWVVGLVLSQLFGLYVASWFENLTGVPINPRLTSDAILMATALGILIPIISSIFPIRNALGKNLHDSLDINRSKTMAVQVTIDRAEDNTFSTPVLIVGIALALFGFGVYYVFPLSLLAMNFALLLNMFFFLLIGMLFGMVLLSLNVGQMLERITVWGFFWWENASVPQVVLKNLVAHRVRNRKTTIMYALSLGFIIFINVTYQMQMSTMTYQTEQSNGAYIKVQSNGKVFEGVGIDRKDQLETIAMSDPSIAGFAWVSLPLSLTNDSIEMQEISNLGHLYRDVNFVYAVSPNFFEIAIPGFLNINEVAHDPDINLANENQLAYQLYSAEGSKSMILGTRYKDFLGLSLSQYSHFLLDTTYDASSVPVHTRLKPMAFLDSAPIFTFSKFPSVGSQSALVSFTSYVRLSKGTVKSVEDIPMKLFLIKLVSGATDEDKDRIMSTLNTFVRSSSSVNAFDYRDVEDPLATASVVIMYFFQFTTVIAMLISFFSLMSSMFTNVHEQTKEIGILRAIGISKPAMYRIYMYEAFVLVFSSSLLGLLIGCVVGYTVLLQRILFTQLPIPFVFPTQLLVVVFLCSIVFAVMAAFGPIRSVISKPVVNTLRGS